MSRMHDFLFGNDVRIIEYANGYGVTKNDLYSRLEGESHVFYVPLPGNKMAIMTGRSGIDVEREGRKLDLFWKYYKIGMKNVVNTEEEAAEICKTSAEELAKKMVGQRGKIAYETFAQS